MTREELAALMADIIGLRLQPIMIDTILTAVDRYVDAQVKLAIRETENAK